MNYIHLEEINSTNSYLLAHPELEEGTVVYTMRQTAGRGQMGNTWESEADRNISFSIQLKPTWVAPRDQFLISQIVSFCIWVVITKVIEEQQVKTPFVRIKWPNDIYVGDKKIAGILIENQLQGNKIAQCVVGIGINVNQEVWHMGAPNPTSLKLIGINTTPEEILKKAAIMIYYCFDLIQTVDSGKYITEAIRTKYNKLLYRKEELHPYQDAATGEVFMASIMGVAPQGPLVLITDMGETRKYWFKEVKFIHPNGLTKE